MDSYHQADIPGDTDELGQFWTSKHHHTEELGQF